MPALSVTGVIPCKPCCEAKTRLAPCLTPDERAHVCRHLLLRTIHLACSLLERVVVVSRDAELLAVARQAGAIPLAEESIGLNAALTQATLFAEATGATSVLVLPADLPLVTSADISAILRLAETAPAVVLAPCRHGTGTNALLMAPPSLIPFDFGEGSFARHVAAAGALGIRPAVYHSPTIAFDLDAPEDWQLIAGQVLPVGGNEPNGDARMAATATRC